MHKFPISGFWGVKGIVYHKKEKCVSRMNNAMSSLTFHVLDICICKQQQVPIPIPRFSLLILSFKDGF